MIRNIEEISIFADGLDHPECVATHPDGSVWAGGEGGQVYRISADGDNITEVVNTGGFVLGIAFSPRAEWLAICDLKQKCVWKFDLATHKLSLFANGCSERHFNIPNYPVFDNHGRLYVSESGAFRQVNGCIMRFDTNGEGQVWHPGPFSFTNGMAFSADQRTLYIVCSWLPGIESISIDKEGRPGERNVVLQLPETCPDGITIDVADNIYLSCYAPNAIYKISPSGKLQTLVSDWESHTLCNPTNMAFGGTDNKKLFVANLGRWHIASMQMELPGLRLVSDR